MRDYDIAAYRNSLEKQSHYAKELRAILPKYVFSPVPGRIWWLYFHVGIMVTCGILIFKLDYVWLDILLSLVIGHSMACNFFLGHEITHGAVVKNKKLIHFYANICFVPWGLYGSAWIHAHNGRHHQHTQHSIKDPDCFGSKKYRYNKILQQLTRFLPGSGTWMSYTFLFWFFTFYTFYIVRVFTPDIFPDRRTKTISTAFFILAYTAWPLLAALAIPYGFLYFFLVPVLVANFVVMSYIATNHFLNPLTEDVNDPLVNALSVKTWRVIDFIHLNFSYHTEHHIFPYVSPKYAPLVAAAIKEKFPGKYNEMSHAKALRLLYQRPKFYYDELTLLDPKTQQRYPTIVLEDVI